MKILLISMGGTPTTFGNCEGSNYKYGNPCLEYLTSYLRENTKCEINTLFLNKPIINENYLNLIDNASDAIGIFIDISYFWKALEIFKYAKKSNKNITTFSFGRVSSNCTKELLNKCIYLDYAVIGDPEESVKNIIDSIKLKSKIDNPYIATHDDFENKKWAIFSGDINRWPCFDYYEFDNYENNKYKIHCLSTKCDTCSGMCTFCWSRKQPVVFKSVDRTFNEIEYVSRKFKIKNFYFIDNNLFDFNKNGNKERLISLFTKIKELNRNLLFTALVNTDCILEEDCDLYYLMKECGFYSLFLGVDAGNQQDIKLYNKRATLSDNLNALKILSKVGIWARFGFIFFNPFSSLDTIKENYNYLCQIKSANIYHYGSLHMIIFEKTKFKDMVHDNALLGDDYYGIDIYNYRFKNNKCYEYFKFISSELIPLLENTIPVQYLRLKKNYEMAKIIDKSIIKYQKNIDDIEANEFKLVKNYFYHLYIENDIEYCRKNMFAFIEDIKNNAKDNQNLYEKFEKIWLMANIEREKL